MTKMNKKFGLIVSLCLVIIMSVCGCGKETKTYQGYTGDELAMTNQALMTSLIQIPEDELQHALNAVASNPSKLSKAPFACGKEELAKVVFHQ